MKTENDNEGYIIAFYMFAIAVCVFIGLIVYGLIAMNHPGNTPVEIIRFYEDAVFSIDGNYKKVDRISKKNIKRLESAGHYERYLVLRKIALAEMYMESGDEASYQPSREEYYERALSLLDSLSQEQRSYYGGPSAICRKLNTSLSFDSYKKARDNEISSKANAIVDGVVTKPYLGMSDSEISSTELGRYTSMEESHERRYNESYTLRVFYWKDSRGNTIFYAISKDGKVISVTDNISKYQKKESGASASGSSGKKSGSTSPSSGSSGKKSKSSITDGYYAPQDFYEDYYEDFFDFDEAEEYYYAHGGF